MEANARMSGRAVELNLERSSFWVKAKEEEVIYGSRHAPPWM